MPLPPVTFETFKQELAQLVARFNHDHVRYASSDYNEATLRLDFLDPLFRALGWDVGNTKGLIHTEREVDVEVRTLVSGKQKRADYVFRIARTEYFTCEAKKPSEILHDRHIYQAKRDAYARGIPLAILSDFEELKIYIVGARPRLDEPKVGEYKSFNFLQYPVAARELWDILAYENVATGSVGRLIDSLPKRALKLRGRQGYLIKPDHTRALDAEFLNFLDEARRELGSDLLKHNDRAALLAGHKLNEAAQCILDRLVFLRICEDRGIDTGELLASIFNDWYRQQTKPPKLRRQTGQGRLALNTSDGKEAVGEDPGAYFGAAPPPEGSLYRAVVGHLRALDQRPPSFKPFFNGQLFKPHFSEDLIVSDEWLANFIDDLTADDNGYNFAGIKVEILGSAYERFLGNILVPVGRGVRIEPKPEVRKAGGVYYTPRYIVDYIVEQTVGSLLKGKTPAEVSKLRFLDPACGSGSFLLRVYERVIEHYLRYYTENPAKRRANACYLDAAGNIRLTTQLKRSILQDNIYGVDIDAQAVEVSQLSLYLKMLEGENRETIYLQADMLEKKPLLPPLEHNIRCGNSLIASDFSLDPAELVRVNAFDWDIGFREIMAGGGFDAVIGNPPYVRPHRLDADMKQYLWQHLKTFVAKSDLYSCFMERAIDITKHGGMTSFIVPHTWTSLESFFKIRQKLLAETKILYLAQLPKKVFQHATVETCAFVAQKEMAARTSRHLITICAVRQDALSLTVRQFYQADIYDSHLYNFQLYTNDETPGLLSKLNKRGSPLGGMVRFMYGFKTADDERYIQREKLHPESRLFIRSAAIERYYHARPREYVWYVPDDMTARKSTARPGETARFESEKILVSRMGKKLIAAYDAGGLYVKDAMLLLNNGEISIPLKYILAILNSRLLGYIYKEYFITVDVLKNALLALPVVLPKTEGQKVVQNQLIALVDRMLTLQAALRSSKSSNEHATLQNAILKIDHDIDHLVYGLYGLSRDEITLVEQSTATHARYV